MNRFFLIPYVALHVACANPFAKDNEPIYNTSKSTQLENKRDKYLSLAAQRTDEDQWLDYRCDSLLFNSLYAISGGDPALGQAEDNGRWYRRAQKDCWIGNDSRSSMSRDMLAGLLLYTWIRQDAEILRRLIARLKKSDWDLCEGDTRDPTACLVSTNLKATVYEMAYHMGLDCDGACEKARAIPQAWNWLQRGYTVHVTTIIFLTRGLIQGAINDIQVGYLEDITERNPDNALFEAIHAKFTDGDYGLATELLLADTYFPADELPTSINYCTEYLYQREQDTDAWLPCPSEDLTHNGVEFLFAAAIVLGGLH